MTTPPPRNDSSSPGAGSGHSGHSGDDSGRDPDAAVRRFIDGDLDRDDLQPALHCIADDAEARELLQMEVTAVSALASSPRKVPTGFADRTLSALDAAPDPESAADVAADASAADAPAADSPDAPSPDSLGAQLKRWWDAWTSPRPVRVRPLTATAVLLAATAALWLLVPTGTPTPDAPPVAEEQQAASDAPSERSVRRAAAGDAGGDKVWMRFVYTSQTADSVAVAGDFSNWEPIPLSSRRVNGQTVWTGLVPVTRGEHEYQFVINGEKWVTDPLAPVKRDDGFGAKNAVLKL